MRWLKIRKLLFITSLMLFGIILSACTGPAAGTAEWHGLRANELNKQGCYDEAMEECNKAIELDPNIAFKFG